MTNYIKPSTGEVKSQGAWRNVNKHRSIPKVWTASVLEVLELEPIFAAPTPAPSGDYINVVVSDPVKDDLGNWVQGYVERPMFVEYDDSEDTTITVAAQILTYEAARLEKDRLAANIVIKAQLAEADSKIIRALAEGDATRIATHVVDQAALRAKLK